MAMKLKDKLKYRVDREVIKRWDNCLATITGEHDVYTVYEAKVSDLEFYKGDAYGFFRNIIKLPEDIIYPTMLLNGMQSYSDLTISHSHIKIFKSEIIQKLLLIVKKKT